MSKKMQEVLVGNQENYIMPFFWQHGETEEVLRKYMKAIDEANIGAVCVESRPHPDYCGPKWWEDMDVIMDEARKRNMKVWILDDSHFPTGFANGAMADKPMKLRRRSITCSKTEVAAGETISMTAEELKHPGEWEPSHMEAMISQMMGGGQELPKQAEFEDDELVGVVAMPVDASGMVDAKNAIVLCDASGASDGLTFTAKDSSYAIYTMHTTRNRGPHKDYINMLDKESCHTLIEAVYEPHLQHYGDDFGKTLVGFFSDEPEIGNGHLYEKDHKFGVGFAMDYPWSYPLQNLLAQNDKESYFVKLPLLWETEADKDEIAKARYDYMNLVTKLVETSFSYQMGEWCREHGVMYIGHMIEDNNQHARTGSTLGHYFRGLMGQDMSGIDDIGGQVLPGMEHEAHEGMALDVRDGVFYHYMLGKLANSLSAQDVKKMGRSMCEIFGNYGWQEGVKLEKYLADHFLVRGINNYVPHAFTAKEFPDPDCPPHFYAHGHNPQYRHFGELMKYMNRVCHLISDGRHVSNVAVLYHGEGEWTGQTEMSEYAAMALTEAQIDFDFLPQDVFTDDYKKDFNARLEDGFLKVNTQSYKQIYVPEMEYIRIDFANAIPQLVENGVQVYFIGKKPIGICDGKMSAEELEEKLAACPVISNEDIPKKAKDVADVAITPSDIQVHYYHYVHEDGTQVYMFVNEGREIYSGTIDFGKEFGVKSNVMPVLYDAWENKIRPAAYTQGELLVDITPNKSLIVVFAADDEAAKSLAEVAVAEPVAEGKELSFAKAFTRSTVTSIEYPAFAGAKEITLPDTLAEEEPEFSGIVRYENQVEIADASESYVLEITDAKEAVELFVNGTSMGIQIVEPYIYDISSAVKEGCNDIAIEVATTLEREMHKIPDRYGRPKPPVEGGSGIVGQVHIYCN